MTDTPPFMRPFVLDVEPVEPVSDGAIDWYLPSSLEPAPAVVFVHGGPVPPGLEPRPRGWPVYRGYGAWESGAGLVGVTFDHGFSDFDSLDRANADVEAAVEEARGHPRVDPDRVVVWGFSGGGLLLGPWIESPQPWLRGVAASYPCCRPLEELATTPTTMPQAVTRAGDLPLLLTRVGREREAVAQTVAEFVTAAESATARLDVIDVLDGQHGFDLFDHTEASREAVRDAMAWVATQLRG